MSRRAFVLSPDTLKTRLGIPSDAIVLDVAIDHSNASIRVIVDDPNGPPLFRGETAMNELIEDIGPRVEQQPPAEQEAAIAEQGLTLLPEVERVSVAKIEEGDVIVLETSQMLEDMEREGAVRELQGAFPNNRVLVLDEGMRLKVAR